MLGLVAWQSVAIALAIGLLIGSERERNATGTRVTGVRTFALAALAGAVSSLVDPLVLAAAVIGAAGLMAVSHARNASDDPGATSGIALVLTVLIGGLAMPAPALAVVAGVATTVLLASKNRIHRFVREKISDVELADALKFFVVAFIVLPLMPQANVGPYGAINPRTIWLLVVAVTALGWLGYLAVRLLGTRRGLPAAGLAGGFVSGAATTGAMARIARDRRRYRPALAAALLASVATLIQLVLVSAVADRRVAGLLLPAAAMGAVVLVAEAGWLVLRPGAGINAAPDGNEAGEGQVDASMPAPSMPAPSMPAPSMPAPSMPAPSAELDATARAELDAGAGAAADPRRTPPGLAGRRPFELMPALLLAAILTAMLVVAAFVYHILGSGGSVLAISVAGLADAYAGALTGATLASQGTLTTQTAVLAAMAAVGVNTVVKLVLAYVAGGQRVFAGLAALFAGPIAAVAIGLAATLGLSS